MTQPVRVRFAPSPTGYLHVGGARTALYNYLFAKKFGGKFILRIEDTDLERSTDESLRMQIEDLQWLGLEWDEGVDPSTLKSFGPEGPYRQSERLAIYKKYGDQLVDEGFAYYDFRTDEELDRLREAGDKYTRIPRPDSIVSANEARQRMSRGELAAVRFKVEGGAEHVIQDLVRGEVRFPEEMVGDFVLLRSNGMPVYNFCCAVDDALMEISHVFRAEEHLSNTLRQKMIYDALGFKAPQFGHLSLILGKDKQKLSKRHGATSCHQYNELGYLPEALLNFVALLGWSPESGEEILSADELIAQFDIQRLHVAGAVFDDEKFKWMNSMHLRKLSNEKLWELILPRLKKENIHLNANHDFIEKSLETFKSKMETLNDAIELYRPIDIQHFAISADAEEVLHWPSSLSVFAYWKTLLKNDSTPYISEEEFDEMQNKVKEETKVKGKQLFMPIRVAIIGKPHGSDLKMLVPLIDRQSLIERVDLVLASLGQ